MSWELFRQKLAIMRKINIMGVAGYYLEGNFIFQKTFVFSQKSSQLNIRGMSGFIHFRWLPIERKIYFL